MHVLFSKTVCILRYGEYLELENKERNLSVHPGTLDLQNVLSITVESVEFFLLAAARFDMEKLKPFVT